MYSNGASEVILGKAIKQFNLPRDEIVVMTKVFGPVGRTGANVWDLSPEERIQQRYLNQSGLSRKVCYLLLQLISELTSAYYFQHIFEAVKHSLERLQLDYVDVLQCECLKFLKLQGH